MPSALPDWHQCLSHLVDRLVAHGAAERDLDDGSIELVPELCEDLGVGAVMRGADDDAAAAFLAVPAMAGNLGTIFAGTTWSGDRYWDALKRAPKDVVSGGSTVNKHRIAGVQRIVLFVSLTGWATWRSKHDPGPAANRPIVNRQLRALIERIERIEGEIQELSVDRKDVYAEAKGCGFDTKILRQVIRIRKMDPHERAEQEAILALYLDALGHPNGLDDGEDDDVFDPEPNDEGG